MDLYADLPLAKGARASSALDADGKPKVSIAGKSSVWSSAPLMVPQAAKAKNSGNRPAPVTTSSATMLPSALAGGRGASPAARKSSLGGGISLAFKPASVMRRSLGGSRSGGTTVSPLGSSQLLQDPKLNEAVGGEAPRAMGGVGLGFSTVTEVRRSSPQGQNAAALNGATMGSAAAGHFFQVTYRDEYHPARPNSYEAYCKERLDKKKLDQVKRELGRRQREQEREGKIEREKLVKDLAEGRAPAMELPMAAGRGRGMTMPAWMRKKIEESGTVAQPESERDVDRQPKHTSEDVTKNAVEGQFEDAAGPRGGLGFSRAGLGYSRGATSEARVGSGELQASGSENRGEADQKKAQVPTVALDEFGREVPREPAPKQDARRSEGQAHNDANLRRDGSRKERRDCGDGGADIVKRRRTSASKWDSRSSGKSASYGRVVLLQNMVGPGEVDDELQEEVKGECAEKYGPVTKCVIYEVTGRVAPEEAVRIFVQFEREEGAGKALAGLSGRFFGGRKVKATLYDETKFERMDLTGQ